MVEINTYVNTATGENLGQFESIEDATADGLSADIVLKVDTTPTDSSLFYDVASSAWIPDLDTYKVNAKQNVLEFANDVTSKITSKYPNAEIDAWPKKENEARLIMEDTSVDPDNYPLLKTVCVIEGGTDDLVVRMKSKATAVILYADQYIQVSAMVEGLRSKTDVSLDAASSEEEVDTIIDAAKTEAEQLMIIAGL